MSKKLDLSSRLNFDPIDLTAPDKVIKCICQQLSEQTNGCVIGAVEEYSGRIESYTQKSSVATMATLLGETEKKINIQNSLGKIGNECNRFEFYLRTPIYEDYKYRILFFEYGTGNYPVKVVLEQGVAEEILGEYKGYITFPETRDAFENLIYNVLSSSHIVGVMQELINISRIKAAEIESDKE